MNASFCHYISTLTVQLSVEKCCTSSRIYAIFIHLLQQLFMGQSGFIQGLQTVMARQNLKQSKSLFCAEIQASSVLLSLLPQLYPPPPQKRRMRRRSRRSKTAKTASSGGQALGSSCSGCICEHCCKTKTQVSAVPVLSWLSERFFAPDLVAVCAVRTTHKGAGDHGCCYLSCLDQKPLLLLMLSAVFAL